MMASFKRGSERALQGGVMQITPLLAALAVFASPPTAIAQGAFWQLQLAPDGPRDAVQSGQVMPLREIVRRVQSSEPGELLDAQLVQAGNRAIYVILWLTPDGRRLQLDVDAQTGRILSRRGG
jgi:hypothetical protein